MIDARGADALAHGRRRARRADAVVAVAGDVTDPAHRAELVAAAERLGAPRPARQQRQHARRQPAPPARPIPLDALRRTSRGERRRARSPSSRRRCPPLRAPAAAGSSNITSDAAVEGYEGWGGYGSSKAALEQLANVLAAEEPDAAGATGSTPATCAREMHQDAFPGEDISDRPAARRRACPGSCAPDRGRPPERPLPRRGDLAVRR